LKIYRGKLWNREKEKKEERKKKTATCTKPNICLSCMPLRNKDDVVRIKTSS
jgi:hypothetical protein